MRGLFNPKILGGAVADIPMTFTYTGEANYGTSWNTSITLSAVPCGTYTEDRVLMFAVYVVNVAVSTASISSCTVDGYTPVELGSFNWGDGSRSQIKIYAIDAGAGSSIGTVTDVDITFTFGVNHYLFNCPMVKVEGCPWPLSNTVSDSDDVNNPTSLSLSTVPAQGGVIGYHANWSTVAAEAWSELTEIIEGPYNGYDTLLSAAQFTTEQSPLALGVTITTPSAYHGSLAAAFDGFRHNQPASFSLVGEDSGEVTTIDLTGISIAAGDVCIITNRAHNNAGTTISAALPSGFTQLDEQYDSSGSSRLRAQVVAKILAGTETTLTGYTLGGSTIGGWTAAVFRPSSAITSFVSGGVQTAAGAGDQADQTLRLSRAPAYSTLGWYQITGRGGYFSAAGPSPAMTALTSDYETTTGPGSEAIGWCQHASEGVDRTISMTSTYARSIMHCGYLTFE